MMGRSSALLMSDAVAPHHVMKPMTLGSALGGIEGQGGPLIDAESRHSQQHLHPSAIMRPDAGRRVQRAEGRDTVGCSAASCWDRTRFR